MTKPDAGLTPQGRRTLRAAGIALFAAGLAMELGGFFWFGFAGLRWVESFGSSPPPFLAILLFIVGGFVLTVGLVLLAMGFLRPISRTFASEAAPAIELQTAAMARGVRRAIPELGGAGAVRVRCRHCGSLENEEARFCSKCGKSM